MTEPESTPTGSRPAGGRPLARLLWLLAPLVVWLAVIVADSSDIASSAHTDVLLLRVVRVFSEGAASGSTGFSWLSFLVRKTAHVIEYGILGALLTRATRGMLPGYVRGRRFELLWRAASVALPCGLVVSLADEIHQTSVPSRVGSPKDVAWDFLGLLLGLLAVWLVWRRRQARSSSFSSRV